MTPLMHASQNGFYDIVKLLLKYPNIDLNIGHKFGVFSTFL